MSECARSKSRSPLRSRSHSPVESYSPSQERQYDGSSNLLHFKNIPKYWDFMDVKKTIANLNPEIANSIQFIRVLKHNGEPIGECVVIFKSYQLCIWAFSKLQGQLEHEGKQIHVKIDKEASFPPKSAQWVKRKMPSYNQKFNKPNLPPTNHPTERNESSHYETYGLSTSYLNSLGIEPPLLSRIFVANLDDEVDETKLREVFSLAGNIVVFNKTKINTAKIEYEHPVEAVQAVSMFHEQLLFNKRLIVNIDKLPLRKRLMPAGLFTIGPGLGQNGEPLRGVLWSMELQPIKQLVTQEIENLKQQASKASNTTSSDANNSGTMNASNNSVQPTVSQLNPFSSGPSNLPANNLMTSLVSLFNPQVSAMQGLNSLQAIQNLMQQNQMGDMASQFGAMQAQQIGQNLMGQNVMGPSVMGQNVMGQNMMGFGQTNQAEHGMMNQMDQSWTMNPVPSVKSDETGYNSMKNAGSFGDNRMNYDRDHNESDNNQGSNYKESANNSKCLMTSSDMLVFSNLPSSVTLSALTTKMREVGVLRFADMSGQGRAIVRFENAEDALRCIKLFDRSKVDGQMIDVNFF